jgi:hypothetical protein
VQAGTGLRPGPVRMAALVTACAAGLLTACAGPDRATADRAAAPDAATDAAVGLVDVSAVDPHAPSSGILYFDYPETPGRGDTMTIHARPEPEALLLARYVREPQPGGWWVWRVTGAPAGVDTDGASLEFTYEEEGLPFDSLAADVGWVRVIYGTSNGGLEQRGWAPLVPGRTAYRLWSELLAEMPLFFRDGEAADFHDAPEGRRLDFTVPLPQHPGDFRYIMYPLATHGRWMQVRVVVPSDYCEYPPPEITETVAWIPFLAEQDGRPRVWFFTRGC